jgi:DHA1 family multidrug resistance protein-like MFS transporter
METSSKNIYILAFTLIVVMLGFGLVIPIIPYYVESMGAGGTELGLLVASYAVMRLIFGPFWGNLSDRIGRKPVMMVGMLGYAITMFWFGLATELWMLFLARSLSGILSSATSPTTMAYISDSTSEEDRGRGMGILGAAVGLGTVLGPGIGGWLAGDTLTRTSLSLPFYIAGSGALLALLLIWLLLPESLPSLDRQTTKPGSSGIDIRQIWKALYSPIGVMLFMALLVAFAVTTFFGIFGLYALDKFGYGPSMVGIVLMVVGLVSAMAQGLLTGPLTKKWGEPAVIQVSLLAAAIGFAGLALAASTPAVLIATAIFALGTALLSPAVTSLTSKYTHLPQGVTMGLSNSFMSLGRIIGPLWAGFIYDINVIYPYLSGAVIMVFSFFFSLVKLSPRAEEKSSRKTEPEASPGHRSA